jgi:hypothetical protein
MNGGCFSPLEQILDPYPERATTPRNADRVSLFYLTIKIAMEAPGAKKNYKGKDVYSCFYRPIVGEADKHACAICEKTRTQNISKGYANLLTHINSHDGWEVTMNAYLANNRVRGPMDAYIKIPSEKANKIFGWLDWIISDNLSFIFCQKPLTRKYTKLGIMSVNTLKKYMTKLEHILREKIKASLPPTFGLTMDGWSVDSNHFSGIFAIFTDRNGKYAQYLLSCNVADDFDDDTEFDEDLEEDDKFYGFTAADWFDVIRDVLLDFGIEVSPENIGEIIEFFLADNCSTNRRLAIDAGNN